MATKPLDDATRERLKKIAQENKGRSTLKGLDTILGGVALDFVQERYPDDLKYARLRESRLELSDVQGPPYYTVEVRAEAGHTKDARVGCWRVRGEKTYNVDHNWVQLKSAQPWLVEQFVARFPSRRVMFKSYKGPDRGVESEAIVLHPLPVAVAFLQFVWPKPLKFGDAAQKYIRGFTDKWVHDFPAPGARVKVKGIPFSLYGFDFGEIGGEVTEVLNQHSYLSRVALDKRTQGGNGHPFALFLQNGVEWSWEVVG